jgi:hypothetical protein
MQKDEEGVTNACQVEDRLARRSWHDELLASGILGVLKAWIEPMPDGNLPNIKVGDPLMSPTYSAKTTGCIVGICGAAGPLQPFHPSWCSVMSTGIEWALTAEGSAHVW